MKKWKLITLICSAVLLIGVIVLLIVIFTAKDEQKYKYPTVQPTISNPTNVYLEVGNKKVTYKELYDLGLISYGLTALIDLTDDLLIDIPVSNDEIEEHRKNLYAAYNNIEVEEVDFNDEEQTKVFVEQMNYQGYMTEEEITAAIKLDLKRNKKAKEMLEADIAAFQPVKDDKGNITQELYFTKSQITSAILSTCPDKAEIIYLTFRSESEAYKLMEEFDIDKNNLASGWFHKSTKAPFTKEEILDTFVKMYNKLNETDIVDNKYPVYTQQELSKISSALANGIFTSLENLDEAENLKSSMTVAPKKYATGYYYLAVKKSTTVSITVDQFMEQYKAKNLNECGKKVYDNLVDTAFTSSIINTYLYKNRLDNNIKIYDEGLDIKYINSSASALKGYLDMYQGTTEESATYLLTINCNGTTKHITADQLMTEILKRYGTLLVTEYINRYMMFNEQYSTVYDYAKGNKYEKYAQIEKSEILTYKAALEDGSLETYGYSKHYGWENFITDYFGVQNETELVMLGDAYSLALEKYGLNSFTLTNDVVNEIYKKFHLAYELTRKDAGNISIDEFEEYLETLEKSSYENTLVYQIMNRLTTFFDVKAGTLKFYVDTNSDISFEDLTEETKKLGTTLIEAIYYIASKEVTEITDPQNEVEVLAQNILSDLKNKEFSPITSITGSTLAERIARLVLIYNNSSLSNKTFSVYKQAGIRLTVDQESSYTDESTSDELAELLKDAWNMILKQEMVIDGETVKFPYTEYTNTAVNAKAALGISAQNPYRIEEYYNTETTVSIIFMTAATNSTWYNYHETSVTMFPLTTVGEEYVIDLTKLQSFSDYYVLSNRDELLLTNAESSQLKGIEKPTTFQNNYISNVIAECHKHFNGDKRISDLMYNYRKTSINDGVIKFSDLNNKNLYLKMLDIIFKQD